MSEPSDPDESPSARRGAELSDDDPLAALRRAPEPRPWAAAWPVVAAWPPPVQAAAGLLVVVAVVAGIVFVSSGRESAPPELTMPTAAAQSAPATDRPATTVASSVVVHAAGAVGMPGLYDLAPGSRVDDLLVAAGGPTAEADLDRLNLAATLVDGERIWVPRRGELEPPPVVSGEGGGAEAGPDGSGRAAADDPLDLNTATVEELDTLPGIGPATADAIVSHREQNGPFTSVDQLIDVRGIGEAKLAQLRDRVRV